jgi:hypothetical protein
METNLIKSVHARELKINMDGSGYVVAGWMHQSFGSAGSANRAEYDC